MRTINKYKISGVAVFCAIMFFLPQNTFAQRFGHGGGGGGFHGGGGGGFHGGGGGGVVRGGGGFAAPAGRSFNGGARNIGAHVYSAPARVSVGRSYYGGGARFSDHAYHNVWGGGRAYFYHPYHPYIWGPRWHPFGFFVGALAADAFFFSIEGQPYYYDDGVYYQRYGSGYSVVPPPIGAVVNYLPEGYITVQTDNGMYFYYGGAFYVQQGNNSFRVVPAPLGAIVTEIPEGATEQVINGQSYLLYNNTYYAPISQNGQDAYQVVQVN